MNSLIDWHLLDDAVWTQQLQGALRHFGARRAWTTPAHGRAIALMFFNPSLREKK